jgi:hypothetical protein
LAVFFTVFLITPFSLEAHFTMAPKIEILPKTVEQPNTLFIRQGDSQASRGDYLDYLQRMTTFDTKYQKVQTNFASHFDLLQGVAFFHPDNVHKYIDSIAVAQENKPIYEIAVKVWVRHQAEIFARLLPLRDQALRAEIAEDPGIKPVLELYTAGAKTALLEELILLGDMEPNQAGITRYVKDKPGDYQQILHKGVTLDTEITPPVEQRRLKKRWSGFRKDVIKHTHIVRQEELL